MAGPLIRELLRRYWSDSQDSQDKAAAHFGMSRRGFQFVVNGKRGGGADTILRVLTRLEGPVATTVLKTIRIQTDALPLVVFLSPLFPELAVA